MKKFPLYIVMVFLFSCEKTKITSKVYYDTLENPNRKVNLAHKIRVTIDTLITPTDIETSFNGSFTVCNKTIVFTDAFFGYLFEFDKQLKLLSKNFGIGNLPHELKGADYMTYSKKTKRLYVLSSKTGILAVIDSKFHKEKEFKINFNIKRTKEEVIINPLPYLMDSYELDYGYNGILKVFDEHHLAIAITSSHPKFNGYFNSKFYYENSRIIALINIEKEYIDRLIGRRPLLFLKNQLPNYDHFNYEINNNTIYLNFYPEAPIYKIDKEEDVVQSAFGIQGSEMKTDYIITSSYEEAYKREFEDYNKYNFYNSLYVDGHLIFRSYTKNNLKNDGLQLYKSEVLVADINFPKGYKIIGKIDNAYYASKIVIKRKEDMVLLKLKFSEL